MLSCQSNHDKCLTYGYVLATPQKKRPLGMQQEKRKGPWGFQSPQQSRPPLFIDVNIGIKVNIREMRLGDLFLYFHMY